MPYINIGNRQDGREKCSNVVSVNYNASEIVKASNKLLKKGFIKCNTLYGKGNSAKIIAKLLLKLPLSHIKKINYI